MSADIILIYKINARVSQKVKKKKTSQKKHVYCKYTETKLTSLFNVIPLDFNASVPAFHTFFNLIPSEKKKRFLVASLTSFAPRQFLERIVTVDETWLHHYEPESKAQSVAWKWPTSPVAMKFKSQPSAGIRLCLHIFGGMKGVRFWFTSLQRVQISSPSDFHMFGPRKEALRGRRFSSDEEVIGAVQNWLKSQPKNL
jgi:hypothetical protein